MYSSTRKQREKKMKTYILTIIMNKDNDLQVSNEAYQDKEQADNRLKSIIDFAKSTYNENDLSIKTDWNKAVISVDSELAIQVTIAEAKVI